MASKKFYSDDDIQLAKAALSELPDLTAQRKTLRDFLDAIRDDIIVLVRTKGYTLADVRDTLKNAGYEVGRRHFVTLFGKQNRKNHPAVLPLKQHLKRQIQAGKMASI
ncbi:molybdopterin-guanine dinucleotide biosynthesis protein MobC [Escherichia coli]|nr:molybdopterin-guanine dinucleotide biosynthesis protein MobC [Escherichia coli]EJM3278352.1 molybdopterin-guanine dinucleotide biosynthesis protein MobC [Escherichia coli]